MTRVSVNLPSPLYETVVENAAAEHRSIASYCLNIISGAITTPVTNGAGHASRKPTPFVPNYFDGVVVKIDSDTYVGMRAKYKNLPNLWTALEYADAFLSKYPALKAERIAEMLHQYLDQENRGVEVPEI